MTVGTFLSLLTLMFIGLKLTGYIAWGWLAVLAPIWIPATITLLLFLYFLSKAK